MHDEIYRFELGLFHCTIIKDESGTNPADKLFEAVPEDERQRVLAASLYNPEAVELSYNVLLVDMPTHRVLIDTGNGVETGGEGRLLPHLAEIGIDLETVDVVILTHAHADHYAGMLTAKGEKIFPNAQYVMWRDEWTFYSSDERLAVEKERSQERYDFIHQYFLPLKDKLTLD